MYPSIQSPMSVNPLSSEEMVKFREVYDHVRAGALESGLRDDIASDWAHVAAGLDSLARKRCIRVQRYRVNSYEPWVVHRVLLIDKIGGKRDHILCGGEIKIEDLDQEEDTKWPLYGTPFGYGLYTVKLMICKMFPDHWIFKRSDGSPVQLGDNGNRDHYVFTVVMNEADIDPENMF